MNLIEASDLLCGFCWSKFTSPDFPKCLYKMANIDKGLTDEQIVEYSQTNQPCPDHNNYNDGTSISGKAKWLNPD